MKPMLPTPATPRLSPLAEVVLAFSESEPEACALLQPFDEALTRNDLEVRVRQRFANHPLERRTAIVDRAAELLDLSRQGGSTAPAPAVRTAQPVSPEQRERLRGILEAAFNDDPGLTPKRAKALLDEQSTIRIPTGTFYGTYWTPVLARLSPSVRAQREARAGLRPRKGKLEPSDRQREEARQEVAKIKRDHPDWHEGEIMDEVARRTGLPFKNPVSFKRYYVDPVAPAPARSSKSRTAVSPRTTSGSDGRQAPPSRLPSTPTDEGAMPQPGKPATDGLAMLLAAADELRPAHLLEGADGCVQMQLNLQSMPRMQAYQLMSLVYAEMARHAGAAAQHPAA